MRASTVVGFGIGVLSGCGSTPASRPPVLVCDTDVCTTVAGGPGGGGGGGGGGGHMDAGRLDASATDASVDVSGSVTQWSALPLPASNPRGSEQAAVGWTVEVADHPDINALTDGNGAFSLAAVPTFTFSAGTAPYYGVIARPMGARDLGSFQVYPVGVGAANLTAVSSTVLQFSIGGGVSVDTNQGHMILSVMDSLGSGARPVAGVAVTPTMDSAFVAYDTPDGLSASNGATGASGMVVVANLPPATGGTARSIALRATRAGNSLDYAINVYGGVVTWATILAP